MRGGVRVALAAQVDQRQRPVVALLDVLAYLFLLLAVLAFFTFFADRPLTEADAQRLRLFDGVPQRPLQQSRIDGAPDLDRFGGPETGTVRVQLLGDPHARLRRRQRQPFSAADLSHGNQLPIEPHVGEHNEREGR
ncbi:hypothetical protein STAL104432_31180 [Streptomyces albus]